MSILSARYKNFSIIFAAFIGGVFLVCLQLVTSAQSASVLLNQNSQIAVNVADPTTGTLTKFVCTAVNPTPTTAGNLPTNTPVPNVPTNTPVPNVPTNTPTQNQPTNTPVPNVPTNTPAQNQPTNTPAPPSATNPPAPTISGDFPCGKFPDSSPGCVGVSYQSWFDNVAADNRTMASNYSPMMTHQHYECSVPNARKDGSHLQQGMKIACRFVRYNHITDFNSSNSAWYRSQSVGNTYEQYDLNIGRCQSKKYDGIQCIDWTIHNVSDSLMKSSTEIRITPNVNFQGYDGGRHFLSSNWQTQIGYRSNPELTTRYWHNTCGNYQRMIIPKVDDLIPRGGHIPVVSGTVNIPIQTSGGCGTTHKTFVYIDPKQHTGPEGSNSGITLFENNTQYSGNITWNTLNTKNLDPKDPTTGPVANGVHEVLFLNLEGTGKYVSASGIMLPILVQN